MNKTKYWETEPIHTTVLSTNYNALISKYGVPEYIKCDIEGLDYLLIKQITQSMIYCILALLLN